MTDTLEALAEKADAIAARFREPASFELVRACLNETGILRARAENIAGPERLAVAQAAKREADRAEAEARRALERAVVDAESLLVPPKATKGENGETLVDGREVVSWVAADKAAWRKREAAKDPDVVTAEQALRQCEQASAEARDALVVVEKRNAACRADLDAAIAQLNALRDALPARRGGTD